jgi:hypothetical protein
MTDVLFLGVSPTVVEVVASPTAPLRLTSRAPFSVYYKASSDVSPSSHDGVLAQGQTLVVSSNQWLITATASGEVEVESVSGDPAGGDLVAEAVAEAASDPVGSAATGQTRAQTAEQLLAPKASPALTGTPTAPTAAALDASTKLGTTAYVDSAVGVEKTRALAAEGTLLPSAQKGAASGVASLDSGSHLTAAQIPSSVETTSSRLDLSRGFGIWAPITPAVPLIVTLNGTTTATVNGWLAAGKRRDRRPQHSRWHHVHRVG